MRRAWIGKEQYEMQGCWGVGAGAGQTQRRVQERQLSSNEQQ